MVETAEATQVCRAASTLVYPALELDDKPCGTYTRADFLEILSRIAFDQEFANTGGKTVQLDQSDPVDITSTARNPLAKSLLYHFRQVGADAIDAQFDGVRNRLFQTLRSLRLLPRQVDVAIDLHQWRFYGSADTDHVLITYPDLGANRAYCFATLCIVAPGVRFTLAVLPMDANGFRAKQEAVCSLILEARRYVSIRHVYLDRGFYQVHVVEELDRLDIDFIVRARPSTGMKGRLSAGAETVVDTYQMQRKRPPTASVDVSVFAVPHRTNGDEHVWFVTNLDVESETARAYAAAFSTALLGLLVPDGQALAFVASVAVASTIVAAVFTLWRRYFYERRARLLYESTDGGDRIIVPMYGENPDETAMLAGRLAAAHEAGKVVLMDFVSDDVIERTTRGVRNDRSDGRSSATDGGRDSGAVATDDERTHTGDTAGRTGTGARPPADPPVDSPATDRAAGDDADREDATDTAERRVTAAAAARLERRAAVIESEIDVPCQTVAATGRSMATTVRAVAHETDCDLIAASYEERHDGIAPEILELFQCEMDVLVHRSADGRTEWSDVLVPVRRASDLAHSMLDFGSRLAGETGHLSLASCVGTERERRRAEEMLANLAETVRRTVETRVSTSTFGAFLERNGGQFDAVMMGASRDRSGVSRFFAPPAFERIDDPDIDVIIVDRP